MNIIVTGSNSAIGINLISKLINLGHRIIKLGDRHTDKWRLGDFIPRYKNTDVLIHLAHDRNFSLNKNIYAVEKICESFNGKKIFLSSLSAHSNSISRYGKSKFAQEDIFLKNNGVVIRSGIVFGENVGGIYSSISEFLNKYPVLVIPYYGLPSMFMSHIDDLTDEIVGMTMHDPRRPVFGSNCNPISLFEVFNRISIINKTQTRLITLPVQPFDFGFRFMNKLRPNLKFIDSILSVSKEVSNYEISQLSKAKTFFRPFLL